jgi:hypothetical protein
VWASAAAKEEGSGCASTTRAAALWGVDTAAAYPAGPAALL